MASRIMDMRKALFAELKAVSGMLTHISRNRNAFGRCPLLMLHLLVQCLCLIKDPVGVTRLEPPYMFHAVCSRIGGHAVQVGAPGTWDHIINQIGMFSYTGLNKVRPAQLLL